MKLKNTKKVFFKGLVLLSLLYYPTSYVVAQEETKKNFTISSHNNCSIIIESKQNGTILPIVYSTLPANQSGINHNNLWIWRASEVPWKYKPMKLQPLPEDATQSGSYVLGELVISPQTAYTVCYSLGAEVSKICACGTLNTESDSIIYDFVNMNLTEANANSLAINYTTVTGFLPQTYKNWVGLWEGSASPYNSGAPMAIGRLKNDSNTGEVAINNLNLVAGRTYTLIYFLGEDQTTASVMIRFILQH